MSLGDLKTDIVGPASIFLINKQCVFLFKMKGKRTNKCYSYNYYQDQEKVNKILTL